MSRHFVGRVIFFNPEPVATELTVDIPSLSQPADVDPRVLLDLADVELSNRSRERLRPPPPSLCRCT